MALLKKGKPGFFLILLFLLVFNSEVSSQGNTTYVLSTNCAPSLATFHSSNDLKSLNLNGVEILRTSDADFTVALQESGILLITHYSSTNTSIVISTESFTIELQKLSVQIVAETQSKACPGEAVTFSLFASEAPVWKVENGRTFTGNGVKEVFTEPKEYKINVSGNANCGSFSIDTTVSIRTGLLPAVPHVYSSKALACPGEEITFFTENVGYTSMIWENGDMQNPVKVSEIIPRFRYSNPGTYSVKLTATNKCGLSSSGERVITIAATGGNEDFLSINQGGTIIEGCPGEKIAMEAHGINVERFTWKINNEIIEGGPKMEKIFPATGIYPVELNATDYCGTNFKATVNVAISSGLSREGNISTSSSTACAGEPISFYTDVEYKSYKWGFGTSVSYEKNPVHVFQENFMMTVGLDAIDFCGNAHRINTFVKIGEYDLTSVKVEAPGFKAVEKFCVNEPIAFEISDNSVWKAEWDFGDGTPLVKDKSIRHSYSTPGLYFPVVKVYSYCGKETIYRSTFGIVIGNNLRYSEYQVQNTSGLTVVKESGNYCINEPVEINVNYPGVKLNYNWNDGTPVESGNLPEQTHYYKLAGKYTIEVVATNGCGNDTTFTKSIEIGNNGTGGENSLNLEPVFLCPGDHYQNFFGNVAKVEWTINEALGYFPSDTVNANGVLLQRINHQFKDAGIFTLKTHATDFCGNVFIDSAIVKVSSVAVNEGSLNNSFALLSNKKEYTTCEPVQFAAYKGSRFTWNFGDGNPIVTTTLPMVSYNYGKPGLYKVSLVISDGCNSSYNSRDTVTVVVKECPVPEINVTLSASPMKAQVPAVITFTGEATGVSPGVVYEWFVNNQKLTGVQNPILSYTFGTAGKYEVKLVASDRGVSDTAVLVFNAFDCNQIKADFTVANVCKGSESVFIDNSTGLGDETVSYKWYLNNNLVEDQTGSTIKIKFPEAGNYFARLILETPDCIVNSFLKTTVVEYTNVNVVSEKTVICESDSVVFVRGTEEGGRSLVWLPVGSYRVAPDLNGAFYKVSLEDRLAGGAKITARTVKGACPDYIDSVEIGIARMPVVEVGPNRKFTLDPITINATVKPSGTPIIWTTSSLTGTIKPNETSVNVIYQPSAADVLDGRVRLVLRTVAGVCPSVSNSLILTNKVDVVCNIKLNTSANASNPNLYTFWASNDDVERVGRYVWEFGDGTVASGKIQSNIYNRAGEYVVKLSYTNFDQSCSAITYDTIVIKESSIPTYQIKGAINAGTDILDKGKVLLFGFNGFGYQYLREQKLEPSNKGNFTFTRLDNGFYLLYALPDTASDYFDTYLSTYSGNAVKWKEGGKFVRINNLDTSGVAISLVKDPLVPGTAVGPDKITGRIVFGEGILPNLRVSSGGTENPVENAVITLYNLSGDRLTSTYTDPYGNYSFENLSDGSYTIGVEYPGTQLSNSLRVDVTGDTTQYNGDGVLSGIVQGVADKLNTENLILNIYPNPASEFLTVNIPKISENGVQVKIYNTTGIVQKTFTTINDKVAIDVSDLAQGMYIIELSGTAQKLTARFNKF